MKGISQWNLSDVACNLSLSPLTKKPSNTKQLIYGVCNASTNYLTLLQTISFWRVFCICYQSKGLKECWIHRMHALSYSIWQIAHPTVLCPKRKADKGSERGHTAKQSCPMWLLKNLLSVMPSQSPSTFPSAYSIPINYFAKYKDPHLQNRETGIKVSFYHGW